MAAGSKLIANAAQGFTRILTTATASSADFLQVLSSWVGDPAVFAAMVALPAFGPIVAAAAGALGAYSLYQEYVAGRSIEEIRNRQDELREKLHAALETNHEQVRALADLIEFDQTGGSNFADLSEPLRSNPWILLYKLLTQQSETSAARDSAIQSAIAQHQQLATALAAAAERHFETIHQDHETHEASLAELRDELRRFQNRVYAEIIESMRPFPPLYVPHESANPQRRSTSRFVYREQRIPFYGRHTEMGELLDFLFNEGQFRWWVWTGRGGAGKSRLALELCLAAHELGWYAGFLERGGDPDKLPAWADVNPDYPLLIVVDYVSERAKAVGLAIAKLRRRSEKGLLKRPVRILLLERSADANDHWFREFMQPESNTDRADINGARYLSERGAREMTGLDPDSLWRTIRHAWKDQAESSTPPLVGPDDALEDRVIEIYGQIDEHGLPLFAAFAGESLAQLGIQGIANWDRDALVGHVLERESALWREGDLRKEHANLAFVATLLQDLDVAQLKALGAMLRAGDLPETLDGATVRQISCFATPRAKGHIPPIEPDPLGECFLLARYSDKTDHPAHFGFAPPDEYNNELYEANDRLLDAAWDFAPFHVLAVMLRCVRDFPNRPEIERLCRPPNSTPESRFAWMILAAEASAILGRGGSHDRVLWFVNHAVQLTERYGDETALYWLLAGALNNRGATYGQQERMKLAIADFDAVLALEDASTEQKAKALNNRGVAYGQQGRMKLAIADFDS
ncbi:MAG: tetratricopeptide repeat protein, partial [Phycisphaerales bacterium]|nr:tetratricopeptide repeat protein [Phycisphaerales bacterium]